MKKTLIKLFTITLAASIFTSCEIGLGASVDIVGPTVSITDPAPRENVMETFDISGTVYDDTDVETLTVTCGGNEWRNTRGRWSVKKEGASDFTADNASEWKVQDDGKSFAWKVRNVDFKMKDDGDYEIVVSAVDSSGNTSGESRKTRTVVVDKEAPVITVSNPVIKKETDFFTEITEYKDITKVSNFVTGDFTISGSSTDENAINYIDVFINSPDNETTYFEVRLAQDKINIPANYTSEKYKIVDSLRAWETDVELASCALKNLDKNKHVLKIVTKTVDSSGNEETKTHGYFCLWQNATYPWIVVNLGTSASPLSVYAGTKILGNAYDDTAVANIYATVKKDSASGEIVGDYNKKSIYSGNDENNVFFNFEVPQTCGAYYVKFEVEDIYGNPSTARDGFIKVEDKTFPSVEISHIVSGKEKYNGDPLFGNKDGNFSFVITASDDTEVASLKIAYMTSDTAVVDYSDNDYAGWTETSSLPSDLQNGKVLILEPQYVGIDSLTQKKKYKIELSLNIFNDLGINGSAGHRLSNQTFVFRVEDENNNAITKDYTILGDIEAPAIEFTNIVYNSKTYTQNSEGKAVSGSTTYNDGIPAFTSNSTITVNGRISDDAITAWGINTVRNKWNSTAAKLFTLTCNKNEIVPEIDAASPKTEGGKTWYNFSATVSNTASSTSLRGSSLVYTAVLRDFNNNEVTQTYAFLVDTQTLKVEYIYTSKSDGCYGNIDSDGTDTIIPIQIRFNKSLKFTKGSSAMPVITLNNGATATMSAVSAAGDREFVFNYKVKDGGSDEAELNVTSVNWNGGTISDSNGPVTENVVSLITKALESTSGINLKDKKKITIIKTLPEITDVTVTPDADYSKTTIAITYSKAVKKGTGNITVTQQNVTKVPPVLSESEYKLLVSKEDDIEDYYEYTTNGADENFNPDLTPKYVLKFEYDADNTALVELYKSTGNYILSQNIKSNKVSINSTGTVVTVILDKLPCIGAAYKIEIPQGFVVDKAGGTAFPVAALAEDDEKASYTFSTTEYPLEKPVIRIKKDDTTVTAVTGGFTASQPMTADVKIDCETPEVTLQYSYNKISVGSIIYNFDERNNKNVTGFEDNSSPSSDDSSGNTAAFSIGDSDYKKGLTYKITATATGTVDGVEKSTEGYEVVQRTTIQINNSGNKLELRNDDDLVRNIVANWPGANITGGNRNSKKLGLFLRGGDNPTGGNTTPGLPTTWNPKDLDKAILFSEESNTFYIVSWKITKALYFMPLAGLMDDATITAGKYQGPKYTCNAQNRWIGTYTEYPVQPGQYLVIANTQGNTVTFEVGDAGKAKMVR